MASFVYNAGLGVLKKGRAFHGHDFALSLDDWVVKGHGHWRMRPGGADDGVDLFAEVELSGHPVIWQEYRGRTFAVWAASPGEPRLLAPMVAHDVRPVFGPGSDMLIRVELRPTAYWDVYQADAVPETVPPEFLRWELSAYEGRPARAAISAWHDWLTENGYEWRVERARTLLEALQ